MECNFESLFLPLIISIVMVNFTAYMNYDADLKNFYQELFGLPIILTIVGAGLYVWLTYEAPENNLGVLFQDKQYFEKNLFCPLEKTFKIVSSILPVFIIRNFLRSRHPDTYELIKEKIRGYFQS